jgi:hypothetical protein
VAGSQIATSFTGEDLSTSLLADDERDRAVEAIFEPSAGPAAFKRALPGIMPDGFDDRSDPPTLVVGREGRLINLIGAVGAMVQSTNENAVRVTSPFNPSAEPVIANSERFLFRLEMGIPGEAQILARMPQAVTGPVSAASLVGLPGGQPSGPVKGPSLGGEKARLNVKVFPSST